MKKVLTVLTSVLILCTSTISAQLPSYVPTSGLLAFYSFTGNANDESGNGYNGTINGASLTNDRFANPNSAIQFNPLNFIEVPN